MPAPAAWIEIARLSRLLAEMPPAHARWLSDSEAERLGRLRHRGRREQFLAGHWLARVLLARAFGEDPGRWQLLERRSQAPAVHGHAGLFVSISHGEDWVAAAVAEAAIGIDLEQRTRVLDASIEPLLLNPEEIPGSVDADGLLLRWVAKEAWIKRTAGSALPARLQHLHLQPSARAQAPIGIDSHAEFHFGLALAPGCRVDRQCDVALTPGAAFAEPKPGPAPAAPALRGR